MKNNKIYVIAEMACSHEGDINLAKEIVDGAGQSGADAIQLQIWSLKYMMASSHPKFKICQALEFSCDQWRDIVSYSRTQYPKMEIYSFIYEHQSIDFIESLNLDGYKLSSSDLSNPYVLDKVSETGKHINLSIGASTLDEIKKAIDQIGKKSNLQITLMYGYQNFPTEIRDINLNYMKKIKNLFELPVGYQDHCDADTQTAFWVPALSAGMGISVLEKHITHDRSLKGIDYQSALNPDEFGLFVEMIRKLEMSLGVSVPKSFSKDELKYREFQKKSIVAARDLKAKTLIEQEDIAFLRTAKIGIPPIDYKKILGKRTQKDIKIQDIILEEDLL